MAVTDLIVTRAVSAIAELFCQNIVFTTLVPDNRTDIVKNISLMPAPVRLACSGGGITNMALS